MRLIFLVPEQKPHRNNCAFGAFVPFHSSPCIVLRPGCQSLSFGFCERLLLFSAKSIFDHRLQNLLLCDLSEMEFFGLGLFWLACPSTSLCAWQPRMMTSSLSLIWTARATSSMDFLDFTWTTSWPVVNGSQAQRMPKLLQVIIHAVLLKDCMCFFTISSLDPSSTMINRPSAAHR